MYPKPGAVGMEKLATQVIPQRGLNTLWEQSNLIIKV